MYVLCAYILGPAPRYFWCKSRSYYRTIGDLLLPGVFEDYLPTLHLVPPRHPRSLYGDVLNAYQDYCHLSNVAQRSAVTWIYDAIRSPTTYGICPDDPGYYAWHILLLQVCIVAMAFYFLCLAFYTLYHGPYRYLASWILWMNNKIEINNNFYRSIFANLPSPTPVPLPGHSHPTAAACRNADSLFLRQIALASGCEPYIVQCSSSDQRKGLNGTREYYWGKDTQQAPRNDPLPPNAMLCLVDVDQYIDMPYFLATNDRPVAIATVQPTKCAHASGEFSFYFDEDSTLHYFVSGGADYHHLVWDYHSDGLMATQKFFGIPYATTVYNIDRRTTSEHHDIVFLTPSAKWGIFATLANYLLSPNMLKRYDLLRGTHLRMLVKTTTGMLLSTALPGQFACATVPAELDNTIGNLSVVSKSGLTRAAIETHLPAATNPEELASNRETATVLYDYYMHNSQKLTVSEYASAILKRLTGGAFSIRKPTITAPIHNAPEPRRFQFGNYNPEAKPNMCAFMTPIIDAAFTADKTIGNEERARDKRILAVQNDTAMTPFLTTCMTEFLELLVPIPYILNPVDHEEVHARQNRPNQRVHLDEADITGTPKRVAKSFIKAEAYPDAKDPRLITTYNSKDKVEYSRYVYAISDWLKQLAPYAFAKTPNEVAKAVVSTCSKAKTVCKTDFSRYDGTVSPAARTFEEALLFRLFAPSHHVAIQALSKAQFNLFVICVLGTIYHLKTSRGSGSPETSAFNTLLNMFATYVGHRMSPGEFTKFCDALEAFEKTMRGLYGGDDGLSPDADVACYTKACKALGLNVKAENIPRGQFGIEFLSRVYGPDVWNGDSANCCNILRQLSKIHVSNIRPAGISNQQMLVDKMAGYAISDANTPYIGDLATTVMALNKTAPSAQYVVDEEHVTWIARIHDTKEVFDNPPREWYLSYVKTALPEFNFLRFYNWIATATCLEDILKAPLCMPWKPPVLTDVPMVVDGELYPPITSTPPSKRPEGKPKHHTKVEKQSKDGNDEGAARRLRDKPRGTPPARGDRAKALKRGGRV